MIVVVAEVVSVVNNVGMAIKAAVVGEEKDVEDDPIMVVEVKGAEEEDVVALDMDEEEKVEDDRDLRDGDTVTEEVVVVVEWEEDEDMDMVVEAGTMVRYWNCAIP
jgi:hypothetical protein